MSLVLCLYVREFNFVSLKDIYRAGACYTANLIPPSQIKPGEDSAILGCHCCPDNVVCLKAFASHNGHDILIGLCTCLMIDSLTS